MKSRIKAAIFLIALGAVSFAVSVIANGLNYRAHEFSATEGHAPQWIVVWHFISIAVTLVGIGLMLLSIRRQNKREGPPPGTSSS